MEFDLDKVFPNLVFKELQEDEFADKDGYPYCKKCKKPRFYKFENGDKVVLMRGKCECQLAEIKNEKKRRKGKKQ